jgi:hypothetical protein
VVIPSQRQSGVLWVFGTGYVLQVIITVKNKIHSHNKTKRDQKSPFYKKPALFIKTLYYQF